MDQLLNSPEFFILLSIVWTLPWKGVALWKAAKKGHKAWFIAILIINTFGLLEILYFFFLSKYDFNLADLKNRFLPSKKGS